MAQNNDKSSRVDRGGGWSSDARYARVAYRGRNGPSFRFDYLGLRLSRIVNPLEQLSEVIHEQ